MSLSRWETRKQSLNEKWNKIKAWTLEKAKSRPARWTMSAVAALTPTGVVYSVLYSITPTTTAWLAVNIVCSSCMFIVAARITSHQLSSQNEIPEKVQQLAKDTVSTVVEQQNDNIRISNENTRAILVQFAKMKTEIRHLQTERNPPQPAPDAALAIDIVEPPSPTNSDNAEEIQLLAETYGIKPLAFIRLDTTPDVSELEQKDNSNADTNNPSIFTQCWRSIRGHRNLRLFTAANDTELTQIHVQGESSDADSYRYVNSPVNHPQTLAPQIIESYQQSSATP